MSAYEELVERCARNAICAHMPGGKPLWVLLADNDKTITDLIGPMRAAIAEVLRTLETVTDGMVDAASETRTYLEPDQQWLAMLHASPLAPPK